MLAGQNIHARVRLGEHEACPRRLGRARLFYPHSYLSSKLETTCSLRILKGEIYVIRQAARHIPASTRSLSPIQTVDLTKLPINLFSSDFDTETKVLFLL